MRKLITALLLLPLLAFGGPNDIVVTQRNSTDTGLAPNRLVTAPSGGVSAIMGYNGATQLPIHWAIGSGLTITSGALAATAQDWATITGKPTFFSGAYSDLTGIPSTFTPAAHTHAAGDIVSGTFDIARIPALAISQTTGLQTALDAKFAAPTGTTSQYLRGDGTVATFPSIPAAQVNADWSASSGVSQILNKPSLATVATSGSYADLSNKPTIPAAQINSDWNATSGLSQILNKPTLFSGSYTDLTNKPAFATVATSGSYTDLLNRPTIPAAQVQTDWNATTGLGALLNKPTTLAGYGITDAVSSSSLATTLSGYATTSALTTGLATKFNTPTGTTSQYLRGDGSLATFPTLTSGTVTSVTAGTGLSGGTITTTGTISMPNTGTAGTYIAVTTDAQGRVTAGRTRSFTYPTRSLNTAFQVSTTQDADVSYTVDISVTSLLLAGTTGRVYLDYADNSAMTTNLVTVNESPNSTGGVLNVTNVGPGNVHGWIPAGKYVRIRTAAAAGTPTFTYVRGEEVLQ